MSRTMTDLRGYAVHEPEAASSKSKLLAATAVILGVVAVGAYAYTSHSLLPSKPQPAVVSQPIALTPPPAQPAATPDTSTVAPQVTPAPEVQAPAPKIKAAPATRASVTQKASEHVARVKARVPDTQSQSMQTVTPPGDVTVPVPPSQIVTPSVTAPTTTTAPAAPDTTQQPATPQTTDQTAPQTPPPQ